MQSKCIRVVKVKSSSVCARGSHATEIGKVVAPLLPLGLNPVTEIGRRIRWRRAAVIGLAVTALGGGVAAADPSWNYVINFNRAPVINEGNQTGNYKIWGLGYASLIIGSRGSNVIVGDGECPPGSTVTDYCSTAPFRGSRSTIIYGNGSGPNTIYSGYGPSVIFGGTGPNTITSAPTSSLIIGGNAGDTIDADQGSTVVYDGTGTNTIFARSREGDTIYCSGSHDTVYAYRIDRIIHCANVVYQPEPGGPTSHERSHFAVPTLRKSSTTRKLDARFKAAEKKAKRR